MKLSLKLYFLILLNYICIIFSACSGGTMGIDNKGVTAYSQNEIQAVIQSGEFVELNTHFRNSIVRGRNIFDAVMKRYQPVIDFYGADSDAFQKLVNTNLLLDAGKLTSPEEKMFNYDSLQGWGDVQFIVEYADGSREVLSSLKILKPDGKISAENSNEGKRIHKIYVKFKDAENVASEAVKFCETHSQFLMKHEIVMGLTGNCELLPKNPANLKNISTGFASIQKNPGYVNFAIDAIHSSELTDHVSNGRDIQFTKHKKLTKLMQGMNQCNELIVERVKQIEEVVEKKANKAVKLDIQNMRNVINSKIGDIENAPNSDDKSECAQYLREEIIGCIAKYIDNSMTDYSNYCVYQAGYVNDQEYLPLQVIINTPYRRRKAYLYDQANEFPIVINTRIDCILANFLMRNPNTMLPFTYEGLEYLKNLYITRLNINSFIETEPDKLNNYNSNSVYVYLNINNNHISRLRTSINSSYSLLRQEIEKTKIDINGSNTTTVQNNLSILLILNYHNNMILYAECLHSDNIGLPTPWYDITRYPIVFWDYFQTDRSNYRPVFSRNPVLTEIDGLCKHTFRDSDGVLSGGHPSSTVHHDYPYPPSIQFESNEPVELVKAVNAENMLSDANTAIEMYYKAKTSRLLEFAASLAALEIQLAMYLDDEDYAKYDPDYNKTIN